MQIKQQALLLHIQKKLSPLFWLGGQDHYLIDQSYNTIRSQIKNQYECEEKAISIQSSEDWSNIIAEANSYSLFSEVMILTGTYDKKTVDAQGKKILGEYLKSINSRCFLIIRASNIPIKQLQWLSNNELALVVMTYPLSADAMKFWIMEQLRKKGLNFEPSVPELIYQHTQGNMLACAQVIEKISLSTDQNNLISAKHAKEHLFNQCDHTLFELIDACLLGQADKSIQILRHAANSKTEAILILWMLSQEVRLLLQLHYLIKQDKDLQSACSQLKIWANRINLYRNALKRLNQNLLRELLSYCLSIDTILKSNLNNQIWSSLEHLSLALCLGQFSGDQCTA